MKRRILHEIQLDKIAAVDFPCQEHAQSKIIKRNETIASWSRMLKSDAQGARAFLTILAEVEERERRWEADRQLWPIFEALRDSINSIAGDPAMDINGKTGMIQDSVNQFVAALQEKFPDVAEEVDEIAKAAASIPGMEMFIKAGQTGVSMEETMDDKAKIADLEKQLGEATSNLAKAKADLAAMTEEKEGTDKECAKLREEIAKAGDETITVGTETISKSAVGEGVFKMMKAMQTEAETTKLEKRVEDEFGNLPGTVAQRAAIVKALDSIADADIRKAAFDSLSIANKAVAGAFSTLGVTGEMAKSAASFEKRIDEIQKRDGIKRHEAMTKARAEFPEEYAAFAAN